MTRFQPGQSRVPAPPVPSPNGHGPTAQGDGLVPSPPVVVREASAPRRWTTKGLALAVIAIVLGGLVVMVGVRSLSTRTEVLAVAKTVPVGARITEADVTTASIASDPALQPIPAGDRASVVGKIALVDLRPGTLLTTSQIGDSDGFTPGQVLVALALKPGQYPVRGVAPGQAVLVVQTPGTGSTGGGPVASGDGAAFPSAGTKAVVSEVGAANPTSGVTVIDVRVPAEMGGPLAALASTGNAVLILLPAGG